MKKIILMMFVLMPSFALAQTYTPPSTWDMSKTNSIVKSSIGVASGVAGLDSNSNVTNNILSNTGTFGSANGGSSYPSMFVGQDMTTVLGSPFSGTHAVQIGGSELTNLTGSPHGTTSGLSTNLIVGGAPDGPFNNACSLCLFTDGTYQNTMIAEVGGDNYLTGKVPTGFDMAGIFWTANANLAQLMITVSSYTSTTAVLTRKLTAQELLLVHQGQYIITNSLSDGATVETNLTDTTKFIAGIVKSVDNTGDTAVITVYAWNTQGSTGTVTPSTTSFDTYYFPNSTGPEVWIGAGTKMFGFNTLMQYDGSNAGASGLPSTAVHALEWGEVDVNVQNETRAGMLLYHGLTFGGSQTVPSGATISAEDVFDKNSYEILLANPMPHHLIIDGTCGDMEMEGSGVSFPATCNILSTTSGDAVMQDMHLGDSDSAGYNYNWRLVTHLTAGSLTESGQGHYTKDTLHFGARINGTVGEGINDGSSALGDIQFLGTGGISFCYYGTNCSFTVDNSGSVISSGQLVAKGNIVIQGTTYLQDSSGANHIQLVQYSDTASQSQLRIDSTDGGKSSILSNIPVTVANTFTANATAILPFGTPATSTSACTQGQIEDDTNYHYVCTATNTWKRIALSSDTW